MHSDLQMDVKRVATWMLAEELLIEVGALFKANAISAMPLKGALLARALYPNPLERPITDVDVLIAPGQFEKANQLLCDIGFAQRRDWLSIATTYNTPQHMVLDVHERLFDAWRYRFDESAIFSRAISGDPHGFTGFVIPAWLDMYAYAIGKFVSDHRTEESTVALTDLMLLEKEVQKKHPAHEVATFLMQCGVDRAAYYALNVLIAVKSTAFAREVLATMQSDPLGEALVKQLKRVGCFKEDARWKAGAAAHLLNQSLPRAAMSALRALPRRVMRKWDR